jgi:glycosyltransferase involved in cell wall biosynthesis
MPKPTLLFADKFWPNIGGMESHADNFIRHFQHCPDYPLLGVVSLQEDGTATMTGASGMRAFDACDPELQSAAILFHNSGRWIESFEGLRKQFPKALHVYRTGGNEIIKARLSQPCPESHAERQSIWAAHINTNIDLLITNSAFTEARLAGLGVACPFLRVIGGVPETRKAARRPRGKILRMFCAARFVPYKNHRQLLAVLRDVISSGIQVELRLAGDGPLLDEIKAMAKAGIHANCFTFLGKLSNDEVMEEIQSADYYVQFSVELATQVEGGSYVHAEGMGRAILEAISAGVFVIAFQTGALSEVVTKGRGLLLAAESPHEQLVHAMCDILKLAPKRPEPTREYSWDMVFETYKQHWRHAL